MRKIRKNVVLVCLLVLVAALVMFAAEWGLVGGLNRSEWVTYAEFWQAVERGEVTAAEFDGDKIFFEKGAAPQVGGVVEPVETTAGRYVTDNPHSPVLAEELMKRGISVTVAKDTTEILSLVFDVFFFAFGFEGLFLALVF